MLRNSFRLFSTADLHDEQPDQVSVIDLQFRSFGAHDCFFGPVVTMRVRSHAPVRDMVAEPGLGRVMVIDADADLSVGVLGDRIAAKAVEQGWAGALVFGAVRDSHALNMLPIGIRALGTTARRCLLAHPSEADIALTIGGSLIRSGDWLYADHDAVLISDRKLNWRTV